MLELSLASILVLRLAPNKLVKIGLSLIILFSKGGLNSGTLVSSLLGDDILTWEKSLDEFLIRLELGLINLLVDWNIDSLTELLMDWLTEGLPSWWIDLLTTLI